MKLKNEKCLFSNTQEFCIVIQKYIIKRYTLLHKCVSIIQKCIIKQYLL